MSKNILLFYSIVALILMSACKGQKDVDLKSAVASFVSNEKAVVGYGYVDVKSILDKSDMKSLKGIGEFVTEQLTSMENAISMDQGIYYAVAGPLNNDGMPEKAYLFLKVKNKDSLQAMFSDMGYSFEEKNGKMVFDDMTTAIGFNNEIAVMISSDFKNKALEDLERAFVKIADKNQSKRVVEVLETKTDILLGTHLENLYGTSNTTLNKLPMDKQAELVSMAKDGHFATTIDFNPGNITIHTNMERVSEELKKAFFFKPAFESDAVQKIGPGKPMVAFATAMDIPKMEKFVNRMNPQFTDDLYKMFGPAGILLKAVGGEGIGSVINGELSFALNAISADDMGGMVPEFNFYASLGPNNQFVTDLITTFGEEGEVQDLGDGYYKYGGAMAYIAKKEMIVHSSDSLKESFKTAPLTSVPGMEGFGKKPLYLFVDLKQVQKIGIPIGGEASEVLNAADYLVVEGDNTSLTVKLQMKDTKENALKQIIHALKVSIQMNMSV
ncbi:MAG: hypothetical protein R3277_04040 [Brumimicrobium sp.]|nr:hypothetical protein [Brumimicrobium sp.]